MKKNDTASALLAVLNVIGKARDVRQLKQHPEIARARRVAMGNLEAIDAAYFAPPPEPAAEWTPLARVPHPVGTYEIGIRSALAHGRSVDEARDSADQHARQELWANDTYTVSVCHEDCDGDEFCHLSIVRSDNKPVRSWRDMQRIKNEVVGPEFEAIEIYPAESRLVDAANVYHLWCSKLLDFRFPWGFHGSRSVDDTQYVTADRIAQS